MKQFVSIQPLDLYVTADGFYRVIGVYLGAEGQARLYTLQKLTGVAMCDGQGGNETDAPQIEVTPEMAAAGGICFLYWETSADSSDEYRTDIMAAHIFNVMMAIKIGRVTVNQVRDSLNETGGPPLAELCPSSFGA